MTSTSFFGDAVGYELPEVDEVPFEVALRRDAAREHSVGEKVVRSFFDRYTPQGVIA